MSDSHSHSEHGHPSWSPPITMGIHHHTIEPGQLNRAFIISIVLNFSFVIVEVAAGLFTNSLALLTDAGHNLGDVAGLALSLFAFPASTKIEGR